MSSKKLTTGLHCKACDAMFDGNDFDDELCYTCYIAVVDMINSYQLTEQQEEEMEL